MSGGTARGAVTLGLGLAVAVALVLWLTRVVDMRELARILRNVRPWPVVWLATLPTVSSALRALRLRIVLQRRAGFVACLHATNIGLMVNCLLPLRSGEICMAVLLGPELPGGRTEALSRLFVDRLMDALAVLVLFAAALPMLDPARARTLDSGRALWLTGAGAILIIGTTWLLCACEGLVLRGVGAASRLFRRPPGTWERKARAALDGLRVLFRGRVLLTAGGLSLAAWAVVAATFHIGMSALFPPPPAACAMLAVSLIVLGLLVAPMPAGISTTHGAIVLALGVFGVPPERALSVAILYHAVNTAMLLLLGWTGLWATGTSLGRLLKSARAADGRGDVADPS